VRILPNHGLNSQFGGWAGNSSRHAPKSLRVNFKPIIGFTASSYVVAECFEHCFCSSLLVSPVVIGASGRAALWRAGLCEKPLLTHRLPLPFPPCHCKREFCGSLRTILPNRPRLVRGRHLPLLHPAWPCLSACPSWTARRLFLHNCFSWCFA